MSSLKELLKKRIIEDVVKSVVPRTGSKWKIVVVDPTSRQILTSACSLHDILNNSVTDIVSIEQKRQPFPDMEAIYFLSPVPQSVDMLIKDYTQNRPPYAAVHLFFTSYLPETLFQKIQRSPVQRFLATCKDLTVDFLALEPHCFSLDLPHSFSGTLNAQKQSILDYEMSPVARRLVSVLATLGDLPLIRYYQPPQPTSTPFLNTSSSALSLAGQLAQAVDKELKELSRADPSWPPKNNYPQSILMIVDRGMDVAAPILHEFTYQAMVNELLVMEELKQDDGKPVVLDENDKIWMSQRLNHIAEVLDFLGKGVKKFIENWNQSTRNTGDSTEKVSQLKETLTNLPEYQELKAKFSIHSNICQDCMSIYQSYDHEKVAMVEQELATGETADGKVPRMMLKDVEALLEDRKICHEDKVRLLMLYIITKEGLEDSERNHLFQLTQLTMEENQAVTNLSQLGVRLSAAINSSSNTPTSPYALSNIRSGRGKRKDGDGKYDHSRYTPVIKFILQDQVKNLVDSKYFPWIREPPAGMGGSSDDGGPTAPVYKKSTWASKRPPGGSNSSTPSTSMTNIIGLETNAQRGEEYRRNGPRIIFFVLGGLTYSELRAAQEVMRETKRDIIIGSTHIITPHTFVDSLKVLHRLGFPPKTPHPYSKIVKPPSPPISDSRSRSRGGSSYKNDDAPAARTASVGMGNRGRPSPSDSPNMGGRGNYNGGGGSAGSRDPRGDYNADGGGGGRGNGYDSDRGNGSAGSGRGYNRYGDNSGRSSSTSRADYNGGGGGRYEDARSSSNSRGGGGGGDRRGGGDGRGYQDYQGQGQGAQGGYGGGRGDYGGYQGGNGGRPGMSNSYGEVRDNSNGGRLRSDSFGSTASGARSTPDMSQRMDNLSVNDGKEPEKKKGWGLFGKKK